MNRRYVGLIIVEAIIIMLLLIGVAVLFVLLNRSASMPALPIVPTYDPVFSTTAPLSSASPSASPTVSSSGALPSFTPTQIAIATQTPLPIFILNGTPIYPTPYYSNNPVRIPAIVVPTRIVAVQPSAVQPAWTATPIPPIIVQPGKTCRNILYPIAVGQQWLYQANAISRTDILSMSILSVNNSQGNVLVNNQSTGTAKQVLVQCEGDIIRSFPFMSVNVLFGNSLNSSMTASYISGVLAPNEAAFLKNNWALAWSSQYLVSGNTVINRNGTQVNVTLNNAPVTLTCQTMAAGDAAFETITVAAGTFRALKVVCSEQGQVTAIVNGISVTGLAEGRSYQWFAPNIGLVKMQVEHASVNIYGASFSLPLNNYLELESYILAP